MSDSPYCSRAAPVARFSQALWVWLGSTSGGSAAVASVASPATPGKRAEYVSNPWFSLTTRTTCSIGVAGMAAPSGHPVRPLHADCPPSTPRLQTGSRAPSAAFAVVDGEPGLGIEEVQPARVDGELEAFPF